MIIEGSANTFCRLEDGAEAERLARERFLEEKDAVERQDMKALQAMRAESFRKACAMLSASFDNTQE